MDGLSTSKFVRLPTGLAVESLSFSGCAWLLSYHIGVIKLLRERCDLSQTIFLGASSGALAAICAATDIETNAVYEYLLRMAKDAALRRFGPVGRMSYYVRNGLEELMPADAYVRACGRVKISVTRLPTMRNVLLPDRRLRSNRELTRIALGSCYIPLYYERPVFLRGLPALDGGATDNAPMLNGRTITVSPKASIQSKTIDIFPSREPPFRDALFPRAETIMQLYSQGYKDAEAYVAGDHETIAASAEPSSAAQALQPAWG